MFNHKCLLTKCGYEWVSKKEKPKQCPRCKRYDWNDTKKKKEINKVETNETDDQNTKAV